MLKNIKKFTQISTLKDFGNKTLLYTSRRSGLIQKILRFRITRSYTLSDNVLANIEYVNLSSDNIFYWINTYPYIKISLGCMKNLRK